uniref:Uncharacterized protein n=1 Tax=Rhizophagus irregularis (strain DAOM 181602 / DAOM 197198 / MUCL 43194) TaxID=747089 RepID=U9T3Y4_RHIID
MLIKLMDKVDWDVEMYLKIQMVEIIHTVQSGESMEVPDKEENFSSILEILASILNIKVRFKPFIKWSYI